MKDLIFKLYALLDACGDMDGVVIEKVTLAKVISRLEKKIECQGGLDGADKCGYKGRKVDDLQ